TLGDFESATDAVDRERGIEFLVVPTLAKVICKWEDRGAMTLKAGDEVRVFERNRYHPDPEGGHRGIVTKVGRKYAAAEYQLAETDWKGERITHEVRFDMATGYVQEGEAKSVRTPEQYETDEAAKRAREVLKQAGLEERLG